MARIGYARVSTTKQDTALQTDALRAAGCERVFENTVSVAKSAHPSLAAALEYLHDGYVLMAWRLDRLGHSLPHLIRLFGALGQLERDLFRDRTMPCQARRIRTYI
ncbi:recombinase family protein [Pollutimonas sp. H1-120]